MKDKLLGKCSNCKKPLYQDQDGYTYPTLSSGGSWFFGPLNQWDYFHEYWQHQCNPNNPNAKGFLIEEKEKS